MQTGQQGSSQTGAPSNGASTLHDLFALTDEQILEIEPEAQDVAVRSSTVDAGARTEEKRGSPIAALPENNGLAGGSPNIEATSHQSPVTSHDLAEPPAWLAAQMKDPWTGGEAKELWNGILQAKKEAADYRAAFATPEDARALKELYPGGVTEARAAAERARVLDDFDRAYFGAAGSSAEQTSASRAQLAARMLREDPAAFREMVFAGLRALEQSGVQTGSDASPRFSIASSAGENRAVQTQGGLKSAPTNAPAHSQSEQQATEHSAHLAAYAAFEKAANEELERGVGATIDRALSQALPGSGNADGGALRGRLAASIRQEMEAALKGDRQLGEQVTQILSGRRLDDETRAQVVRMIGDRARQLVPSAAKRVLSDWTQTTLAAHRGKTERADAALARREVEPATLPTNSSRETPSQTSRLEAGATRSAPRAVDYRKLSDEQILNL
jgi:hypothetical protein